MFCWLWYFGHSNNVLVLQGWLLFVLEKQACWNNMCWHLVLIVWKNCQLLVRIAWIIEILIFAGLESELKTMKEQLTLLNIQLQFERHRREALADRNRRLLGKSRSNRALEEHNSALVGWFVGVRFSFLYTAVESWKNGMVFWTIELFTIG